MTPQVELVDWGTIPYTEALERQREWFEQLTGRQAGDGKERQAGRLILCEHPHVYTLGKSGKTENLLVSAQELRQRGVEVHRVERGGDITYHGPGQIVGYPVLDLGVIGMGLREYIEALEQSVTETVANWGIVAARIVGKTGVWISGEKDLSMRGQGKYGVTGSGMSTDGATGNRSAAGERKICAIGVKASRGVVMHGFALNVSTDLGRFEAINPCGMVGGAVTSMESETGSRVDIDEVKGVLCERLAVNLKVKILNIESYANRKTMGYPRTG